MLALVLAAPFLLIIVIGIAVPLVRNLKTLQQRDQDFERELAEKRRRIRGPH